LVQDFERMIDRPRFRSGSDIEGDRCGAHDE
jgi:hypothetical protein